MRHSLWVPVLLAGCATAPSLPPMEWIAVRGEGFVRGAAPFVPWGFNYDHDGAGRLLEDYWEAEWASVEQDFLEMKALGANVARIHLQLGKFMETADRANGRALDRLEDLLRLAERTGIYLDLTGLGCYHKKDVPAWYDALPEKERWAVQARFWEAVAARCASSPAVFCYDLMNEPVAPGAVGAAKDWLGPAFGDKHFVQRISLDCAGRPRAEVARAWTRLLVGAIRRHDRRHLVTIGLVHWSLDRPGLSSGFFPEAIAPELDFLSIHLYPEKGKVDEAIETLGAFRRGKPVVIEETFILHCGLADFEVFLRQSKGLAAGWIGFYWGKTLEECARSGAFQDALMKTWLELFRRGPP